MKNHFQIKGCFGGFWRFGDFAEARFANSCRTLLYRISPHFGAFRAKTGRFSEKSKDAFLQRGAGVTAISNEENDHKGGAGISNFIKPF